MSASSPWRSSPNAADTNVMNPWSAIDSDYLHPSTSSSSSQPPQLRSRKSNLAANAELVDRHPLRSPSPSHPSQQTARPGAAPRRPSAVASEWKAIGAGLAGLFGASSSIASSSSYQWPADPSSSHIQSSSRTARLVTTGDDDDDDEARKGRPINSVETTLDRLEDWFGLKQGQQQQQQQRRTTTSRRTAASASSSAAHQDQVRVLIHPVAPTDTLSSLALHYGADIQVLRKSNKLWPGDPVQIRKLIYIPVDSCKHRPPNAEIKVVPTTAGGAVSSTDTGSANASSSNTLIFVSKADQEDLLTGTPVAEIPQPEFVADSLAAMRVSDPVNDFMPDTNQAYTDSTAPAFGTSLTRGGSINGHKSAYPVSLTPALRTLNHAAGSSAKRPASSVGGGSNPPSIAASASAASSGFVPPRQPLHVAKVPADQLRFFAASDTKSSASGSRNPGPGDAEFRPGESGIDDLLQQHQQQHNGSSAQSDRPDLSRHTSTSNISTSSYFNDDDDDEEDEWKPNTWHFGSSSKPISSSTTTIGIDSTSSSSNYAGWNDAPPPSATAIVAKAYDGGKAYQKRQAQKSHRLLYDLAAGLPANTGAASKWARPIQFGDSLPNGGGMAERKGGGRGGLGRLLDDTVRGRISVEAAFEGVVEGFGGKSTAQTRERVGTRSATTRSQVDRVDEVRQPAPLVNIDPLTSSAPINPTRSSSGLEQRRRVDWTKGGKHD
ncbi:LysM domain-containing protein [Pseudozyma hubeiensis]|nr:LysM domain-containing protein [Pseudozyma hubeiensis]